MVKVRYVVGGSLDSLAGGGLVGGHAGDAMSGGAQSVPWFRAFYTVPLSFFVV